MFYVLSLKWTKGHVKNLTRDEVLVWWGPDNNGYTKRLSQAGKYTDEQIAQDPEYYNDGESTLAIPCEVVDAVAEPMVFDAKLGDVIRERQRTATKRRYG